MNPQTPSATLTAPLSDADVSELDELLQALPEDLDPLDVEMLDGFLAAVLLQPEPVPPSAWLPFVFDAQGRGPALPDDRGDDTRAVELIMRRHNELAAYIAAREPFDPIIFELEDDDGSDADRQGRHRRARALGRGLHERARRLSRAARPVAGRRRRAPSR